MNVYDYLMTFINRKMSTAKLRINKFEDGSNYKSICITIPADDNSSNIKFSDWVENATQPKKKESDKSSRLVVKIVSGKELKKIDLDCCSREIKDTSIYQNSFNIITHRDSAPTNSPAQFNDQCQGKDTTIENSKYQTKSANSYYEAEGSELPTLTLEYSNPLEHSLQKVNENNARIMENINMLNRTLDYTKKKEILDIICPKSMRTFPCNACGKCFVYETGLKRHYSIRHSIADTQPRWQAVWTCTQCFQVWPRQDQAVEHAIECCKSFNDNQECVREIKTSVLLQCEFCEKVYTSIPRLLRHSKIHTTASNYECNSCGLSFASCKAAEQHWPICPWLTTHYRFFLPKMLLCNACDRKFRNYEQLYNHRFKMGHFMTKTHSNIDSVKTLGMLVYQCELCTLWYTSIPQMITHRSQHHPDHEPNSNNKTDNMIGNENTHNNNDKPAAGSDRYLN